MYMPKLARFTARDPLPADGAVLMGGMPQYAYAYNNPTNQVDPSGLDPNEFPSGDKPGTFNVILEKCDPPTLKLHSGCCCSRIFVKYKPTAAEKAKYKMICVKVWARTRIKRTWWCSNTDNGWHVDVSKDKQSCWPPTADWTDFPGGAPNQGIFGGCPGICATTQIRQDYEGCAIGETATGKQVVIGCTWWGHQCDVTHTPNPEGWKPLGPSAMPPRSWNRKPCCETTCKITRFPEEELFDVSPGPQKPGDWDPITDPPGTYL